MNEQCEDALEQWIRKAFEETKEDPKYFPVYRRMFLPEVDQIERDFKIDVTTDLDTLIDDDSPEYGTCHESVEKSAAEALQTYLATMKQGYGSDYSEAYAKFLSRNCGDADLASQEAFEFIGKGHKNTPDNPAFIEAHAACIRDGKTPEFAKHCADHLIEESCSFSDAFQAATDFEKAYQLMLRKGHSKFHATMYAQAIREDYDPQFAEVFARCAEEQMAGGRTLKEAERFAEIYADLFDSHGSFDEDYEYHDLANEHCTALAEAAYRYRPEFGDKEKFIDAFDQIYQKVSDSPQAGSREWFDEVEARALLRIAAKDAYMAEHGNLRGFEIEEKEELSAAPAPPKAPNFRLMSEEAFQAYRPKSEDDDEDYREEAKYRDWCEEMECDPMDSESRDEYKQQEGDSWDDMDEDDRDGWTDNMNKD